MFCVLVFFSTPRRWKQESFISSWPTVLCPHAFEINSDSWSLKFFCTPSAILMSPMFSDCSYFMIEWQHPTCYRHRRTLLFAVLVPRSQYESRSPSNKSVDFFNLMFVCVFRHNFIGKQIYFVANNNHMFRLASLSYFQAKLLTWLISLQWLSLMTVSVYKSQHVAVCCKQKKFLYQ